MLYLQTYIYELYKLVKSLILRLILGICMAWYENMYYTYYNSNTITCYIYSLLAFPSDF